MRGEIVLLSRGTHPNVALEGLGNSFGRDAHVRGVVLPEILVGVVDLPVELASEVVLAVVEAGDQCSWVRIKLFVRLKESNNQHGKCRYIDGLGI